MSIEVNDIISPDAMIAQKKSFNVICNTNSRIDLKFSKDNINGDKSPKLMRDWVKKYNYLGANIINLYILDGSTSPDHIIELRKIHNSLITESSPPISGNWLLAGGVWSDTGVWDDNAVWED